MRRTLSFVSLWVALGAAFACSTLLDDNPVIDQQSGVVPPRAEGQAGTGQDTSLPCDVQAILENRCIACHEGTRAVAMLRYSDLVAPAQSDPTKTIAQLAVVRMKSTTSPMPPRPAVAPEADEIAAFEEWVNAGAPRAAKSCTDPPPDAGPPLVLGDGGDGGGGPVCTSGMTWNPNNDEGPLMRPGMACNACHQQNDGPNLRIAGTVYPTLHEPDNCIGKRPPPTLTVVITDANNRTFNLTVNASGNFLYTGGGGGGGGGNNNPRAPFRARVTNGTLSRAMVGSVTSGDCNSCHTLNGANGAPGRILAP